MSPLPAAYGYTYETRYTAAHYTATKRTPKGITIHWWGKPSGASFDGILRWFTAPDTNARTSCHYVAQGTNGAGAVDRRVACIVDPDLIAWHAGDWQANVEEIGIECRPEARPEDYDVVAELIARLWLVYGVLPLHPHKQWASTACPGAWDLAKLERLARVKYAAFKAPSTPAPVPPAPPQEDTMPTVRDVWNTDGIVPSPDKAPTNPFWAPASYLRETFRLVRSALAEVKALRAEVAELRKLLEAQP